MTGDEESGINQNNHSHELPNGAIDGDLWRLGPNTLKYVESLSHFMFIPSMLVQ